MARRPARLERAGALTPRDCMWAAIRELAGTMLVGPFSAVEVAYLANRRRAPDQQLPADSVEQYMEGLRRADPPYLDLVSTSPVPELARPGRKRSELWLHRLARDIGVDAPRVTRDGKPVTQGAGNEALWAAMKALREFDCAELAQAASAGEVKVHERTARMYCVWLTHAGYLTVAVPARGAVSKARYRFNRAMNSGPRAPLISEHNKVIDGNSGRIVYARGGETCRGKT